MSQNKTLTLATPFQSKTEHNVQGWERAGSLATGVVMVGKGLRRGGFFGLIQIAIDEGATLVAGGWQWRGYTSSRVWWKFCSCVIRCFDLRTTAGKCTGSDVGECVPNVG